MLWLNCLRGGHPLWPRKPWPRRVQCFSNTTSCSDPPLPCAPLATRHHCAAHLMPCLGERRRSLRYTLCPCLRVPSLLLPSYHCPYLSSTAASPFQPPSTPCVPRLAPLTPHALSLPQVDRLMKIIVNILPPAPSPHPRRLTV